MTVHPVRYGRWVSAAFLALAMTACSEAGVLRPAGPVAEANRWILMDSLAIMLVIVVPTIVAALLFAWWFRAENAEATRQPGFVYSGRIELIVWGIPLLVIMFLGGVIWVGSHRQDPRAQIASQKATLEIDVVALDWKWLFIDRAAGIASVNRLVIPVGTPVHFRITSASVMNAFFVPRLGSMIYAMNGMESQLNLLADAPGRYQGFSSHYSGAGFSDMGFEVRAVTPQARAAWIAHVRRGGGRALDSKAYALLARQGTLPMIDFPSVDPTLFSAIVSQRIPPATVTQSPKDQTR